MTYYDILFSFFIYGFLGWCSEVAFAAFKQHSFVNRGFLNGPICPIYGIGVTVVVASLQPYVGNLILLNKTSRNFPSHIGRKETSLSVKG